MNGAGRFAPSPSGDLHIGNLRTALLAWLLARSTDRGFLMRVEDLDTRTSSTVARRQLADLAAIGLEWDEPVVWQSDRSTAYDAVLAALHSRGLLYECYCSRKDIAQAPTAPHSPPGAYPGTCRNLSESRRAQHRAAHPERPPALRLRTENSVFPVQDALHGEYTGLVDDFVVRRGDGVIAYNVAVVIDDHAQGIDQVVRGDDLLASAPRQAYLGTLLGYPVPTYAHVPLVLNTAGARLAKRDGAVTVADLGAQRAFDLICDSLGYEAANAAELLGQFDAQRIPRDPWIYPR
ncbi:tRNA glutamyl-Q(34) synthetase GluQRS [Mycobacteroides chelonae]|uniref:tRNA glutamyl-Q(34) synthetase GluQRS n=1 Tax=Mycobacteroides chelonae TaxID=1774 RepID=UPI0008AA1EC1|nr:tRNA glutamyl-Q(34) synthetase GluQRS [Mycobacteroides chelonae]MBF9519611.1 tRNA glutamyl-Q(34) synthetase GluQRS [Mycobacteroides chelonae]OHU55856.1 tRNA glutamyl-Q(34) synthetase GluQRS [Mycobacteroides chelonae]PKQ59008.1 tRNA glutamyl-Q(34) synthetase GluQRS [Mycobacterium sp. MHSD3]SKN19455.1 Putative glutamyl-tRNA synthetase or glutamyl-Q tRNA(Asp) synthetase [Mycobacteroides abscessus subsp. bolletii]